MTLQEAAALEVVRDERDPVRVGACVEAEAEEGEEDVLVGVCGVEVSGDVGGVDLVVIAVVVGIVVV